MIERENEGQEGIIYDNETGDVVSNEKEIVIDDNFELTVLSDKEKIAGYIAGLKANFSNLSDPSTKEGYLENDKTYKSLKKARILIAKLHKDQKAPHWKLVKDLDGIKKSLVAVMGPLEEKAKKKNADHDIFLEKEKARIAQAEQDRVDFIRKKIDDIRMLPVVNITCSLDEIEKVLENLNTNDPSKWATDMEEEAVKAISDTGAQLATLITARKAEEKAEVERKEKEAQDEKDRLAAEKTAQEEREALEKKNSETATELAALKEQLAAQQDSINKQLAAMGKDAPETQEETEATPVDMPDFDSIGDKIVLRDYQQKDVDTFSKSTLSNAEETESKEKLDSFATELGYEKRPELEEELKEVSGELFGKDENEDKPFGENIDDPGQDLLLKKTQTSLAIMQIIQGAENSNVAAKAVTEAIFSGNIVNVLFLSHQ